MVLNPKKLSEEVGTVVEDGIRTVVRKDDMVVLEELRIGRYTGVSIFRIEKNLKDPSPVGILPNSQNFIIRYII